MRYDVYVTVWGEKWVRRYLDHALPSQFHPSNFPAVASDADIAITVYTDRESAPMFDEAAAIIGDAARLELRFFDEVALRSGTVAEAMANAEPSKLKHNVQRVTSQHFLKSVAGHDDTAVVLTDSDFVFSQGSLAYMHTRRKAGIRGLAVACLRMDGGTAQRALTEMRRESGEAALPSRELVRLSLDHMHPIAKAFFVDAHPFTPYPTQLNWWVGKNGFVTRWFFPHPLMVVPDAGAVNYSSTMDYDYILRGVSDAGAIEVVRSSDDLAIAKLPPAGYLQDLTTETQPPTPESMARFVVDNTNIRHSLFVSQPVRFIAWGDEEAWQQVEAESQAFIEATYAAAEALVKQVSMSDARNLAYIKSFLGPIEDFMSPQLHAQMRDWMPVAAR